MIKVLSVGGSIIAPENPDSEFLKQFSLLVRAWLNEDSTRKLILVAGGGGLRVLIRMHIKKLWKIFHLSAQMKLTGLELWRLA